MGIKNLIERECNGQCSVCMSEDVTYGISEIVDNMIRYEITCNKCGASGDEWYNVVYNTTMMFKNKKESV